MRQAALALFRGDEKHFSTAPSRTTSIRAMIVKEIPWRSPEAAFAPLAGEPYAHLLNAGALAAGGWAILVAFPDDIIEARGGDLSWLERLQAIINKRMLPATASAFDAPFQSGFVGFVGYEAMTGIEPSLAALPDTAYDLPDVGFGVYDASVLFSRTERRAFCVGRSADACKHLEHALGREPLDTYCAPSFSAAASNFSQETYEAAVSGVVESIRNGDFYQANIAQTLMMKSDETISSFELFRAITENSDATFSGILQYPDAAVISNSPERFFKIEPMRDNTRRIIVEPIKGTRGRTSDPKEDAGLAAALLSDPKDRAENIMIVDLMRNDLARICEDDSIKEDEICALMTLSKVHHLVSRISGMLRSNISFVDVMRALFPSGSVTGAPKVAAMKAIATVEKRGRGPYCGAIGYVCDSGRTDFSVAIRTLIIDEKGARVFAPVGGGVTLRSDPLSEYQETLVKSRGVADVLAGRSNLQR